MNEKIKKIMSTAVIILVMLTILAAGARAFGVTHLGSLHLSDINGTATPLFLANQRGSGAIAEWQDSGTPVAQIINGGGFLMSAGIDLNGQELTLDADADTSLTADTDDQIDIEISGADDFVFTANLFESQTGSVIDLNGTQLTVDADADTTIIASVDDLITTTLGAATGFVNIATGNLKVGDGTVDVALNGEDAYIEGTLEVDGATTIDGIIDQSLNIENLGTLPTIITQVITWTAAAGGSGTLATITDGEIWFIHSLFIRTTTNFDATGDDVTFTIGDGNDADGFIVATDAQLQATFTEATGYAAGWYGIENGSGGAYTLDDGGPFVYAPSGADETIDWVIDETSGETITAGQMTAYVIYTRIQ
jgi:hypothetical protein